MAVTKAVVVLALLAVAFASAGTEDTTGVVTMTAPQVYPVDEKAGSMSTLESTALEHSNL